MNRTVARRRIRAALGLGLWIGLGLGLVSLCAPASANYREDFESTDVTWRLADSDASARVTYHQRSFEQAHTGNASEQIQIAAGRGTYARVCLEIEPTRIIPELSPSLWLKADRAGLQFQMRVVLPRTRHPRTGEPLTTLLYGDLYNQVGTWQRVAIADVRKELERQERVLRTQFPNVDTREAYIDLVVLNAYGGPGLTTLWVDELVIAGHVSVEAGVNAPDFVPPSSRNVSYPTQNPDEYSAGSESAESFAPERLPTRVQINGSVLTVGGRPFLPRMIDYNGEPLDWLRERGFNTIKLRTEATPELLAAAAEHEMWVVAPPPVGLRDNADSAGRLGASLRSDPRHTDTGQAYLSHSDPSHNDSGYSAADPRLLGSEYARVLAWSLGRQLGPRDLTSTRQQVDELRRSDPLARPILGAVDGDLWAYSQMLDAIVADQPVIGSTFPLRQFEAWLRVRRRLMRSETPLWVAVQTEPSVELQTQIDGLLPARGESHALEPNQVRLMTFAAAAAGARGIYFRSNSPLNAPGPTAERRAKTLQMLNAELELLEPWMAGGTPGPSIDAADPNVRIASLMTDRSQILLVTRQADDQQFVSSVPSTEAIHFVVPGSSGTGDVFQVTSQGLLPLTHRRGAGGVRVVLENAGLATLVLVAREQLVLNHVARSVRQASREFPQWRFEEATRQFEEIRAASAEGIVPMSDLQRLGRTAEMYLRETERVLSTGDAMSADHYLVRAESALAQLRRSAWEQAAAAFPSPVTSPLCVSFDTLPLHWRLSGALRSAAWSSNLLAGGEFEDLNHTLASGWQQHRRPIDHVAANVEFSLETPQSGRSCLRMQTWKTDQQAAPTVLEVAPLWITSAATPVEAGQVVRIHGWVRVPEAIEGSLDGLMIFDSFGGQSLAERVTRTGGWREFLLYRVAPQSGDLRLTFSLTGIGEAWLDNVTVTALPPYATIR